LVLQLVKARDERSNACVGKFRIVLERARQPIGLKAQLPVKIRDLSAQLLDARMLIEQRRGLFGELSLQGDALLRQPPHQFGTRASDLYKGVTSFAAANARLAAAKVRPTIQCFLRHSARPSAPRSISSTACAMPMRAADTSACIISLRTLTQRTLDLALITIA